MTISANSTRRVASLRLRLLRASVLAPLLASFAVVAGPAPLSVSAASAFTVATSTSSQALQRPAQDKVAYLHDGSLLIAYYDPTTPGGVHVKHVTNPSTTPVSTEVSFIGGGDAATIYTLQAAGSTEIWIEVGNELSGGTKREQIQYGTYNGTTFTWSAINQIPGGLTNGRQDPSVTWTGKWLIATWWDDTMGGNSDVAFMNWTTDKTGGSGWSVPAKAGTTAAATLAATSTIAYTVSSGAAPAVNDFFEFGDVVGVAEWRQITAVAGSAPTYTLTVNLPFANAHAMGENDRIGALVLAPMGSTIMQISVRHSTKLGATIAVYGARSRLWTRTLLDGAANPSLSNWKGESAVDTFDDSESGFGGPQIAIDETTGKIHVFRAVTNVGGPSWTGVTYWLGTPDAAPMVSGTVTWNSRLVIDPTANATDPPDIAGAVDSTGTVYVFWTTSVTNGSIKYTTLVSPYTSFAPPITVLTPAGSQPRYPHVPAQAPLTYGYVPLVYQTGTGSPFNIVLDTRYPPHPYVPVTPVRLLDTRTTGGPLGPAGTRNLTVAGGTTSVPLTATGVVLNVTVTNTTASSFLTVYPAGSSLPLASNLNWTAGKTVPNLVEVPVGAGGAITFYNAVGSTDVVVDLQGYFVSIASSTAGGEVALTPARITDTRLGSGQPNAGSTLGAGATLDVKVTGAGGVPATGVSGAILNVTATNTTASSFLTVWPKGAARPTASNLNWVAGQTVPNRVFVPVDPATGKISVYNAVGSVDIVVDVSGYFTDATAIGNSFTPQSPVRIADTRSNSTTLGPGGQITIQVTGVAGVPANAKAVILNVTVTNTTAPSFLTVYPSTATRPLSSDLNWVAGQTVPNLTVATLGTTGAITIYNAAGSTDVVVDLFGYFT
jgi:hypothetical protein